jgi:hypothetical protein
VLALGAFGFLPRFIDDEDHLIYELGPNPDQASAQGSFSMCWDWTKLLDKFGVKDAAKDQLKKTLKKPIKKWLEKNKVFSGPAASSAELVVIDEWLKKAGTKIDKIDKMLYKFLPDRLANDIENAVRDRFEKLTGLWKDEIAQEIYFGNYNGLEADIIADQLVRKLDGLFGLFAICDALVMWEPKVFVTATPDGLDWEFENVYLHPLMAVKEG